MLLLLAACSDAGLTVNKSPPSVAFLSPVDGSSMTAESALTLVVRATDRETATEDLTFSWSLEDGSLLGGTQTVDGDEVTLAVPEAPAIGEHVVTVRVVDEDALDAEDTLGFSSIAPPITDADGDGFDSLDAGGDDCDDGDEAIHPGAEEACDGVDQDCDGETDEDATVGTTTFYEDTDGDGYGNPDVTTAACDAPSGWVADATDCDDAETGDHPGATEVCDGDDDDCSGVPDDNAVDAATWYADTDADGFGDADAPLVACEQPADHVANANDCDDTSAEIYPAALEVCDGLDDDCDGSIDEDAVDASTFYRDADSDGYGDATSLSTSCTLPSGYASNANDCDDADADASPAGTEVCDGDDDDCDGTVDESSAVDADTWYMDGDGDGYGDPAQDLVSCDRPVSYVADDTDCDDDDADTWPGADDTCADGIDQDCDGVDPECPLEGAIGLDEADADIYGASSWMMVGHAVARAGDLDDDGLDDLLVCGDDTTDAGDAWVFFSEITGDNSTSAADVHIMGDTASDNFCLRQGTASGGVDLDGDGSDDLVVGAYGDDLSASGAGTAYIYYGPLSGSFGAQSGADFLYEGDASNDYAGSAVQLLEDTDGDGDADVAIAAYGEDSGGNVAGAVYLSFGRTGSSEGLGSADGTLIGEDASDYFGWSLADLGDFDGDGLSDLAVGAYGDDDGGSEAGAAYVFTGLGNGQVDASAADFKVRGEAAGDRLGYAVTAAGDNNGDGYDDLAVGAYKNDDGGADAGAVYLVTGHRTGSASASSFTEVYGADAGDAAGYAIAGGGDVDGDGTPDLLVGAYLDDDGGTDAGAAFLLYGPLTAGDLSGADATLTGVDGYDYAGSALAMVGDTDGDGLSDLLIGAFGANAGSTSAGEAFLFRGVGR